MAHWSVTPRIAILKRATRAAVEAVGGLELAAGEISIGKSQLGRCQSINDGDTLSLRDALALDEITLGAGGPFILRAMGRLLGHAVVALPDVEDSAGIAMSMIDLTAQLGDLSHAIADALGDGTVSRGEAQRALQELHEMLEAGARLSLLLSALAYPEACD